MRNKTSLVGCLLVSGVILFGPAALAGNWPRFRGPNGAGVADEADIPVQFHEKKGILWENKKDFPYVPSLLHRGEHLYFINDKGFASCFQAQTGKQVWLVRQPDTTFVSSPLLIGDRMYAMSEQGDVLVFAADTKYQLLGKNTLGEPVRSSPAVANGRLYIRGRDHLFCIGNMP